MVTASIVLLYVSYSIPVIALLVRGRNNIKHGPFWLGTFGLVANIVLLAWTTFTIIMYSFPYYYPVTKSSESHSLPFPFYSLIGYDALSPGPNFLVNRTLTRAIFCVG